MPNEPKHAHHLDGAYVFVEFPVSTIKPYTYPLRSLTGRAWQVDTLGQPMLLLEPILPDALETPTILLPPAQIAALVILTEAEARYTHRVTENLHVLQTFTGLFGFHERLREEMAKVDQVFSYARRSGSVRPSPGDDVPGFLTAPGFPLH